MAQSKLVAEEGVYFSYNSMLSSIMVGKSSLELQIASHITSTVKNREKWMHAFICVQLHFSSLASYTENGLAWSGLGLPIAVQTISHRQAYGHLGVESPSSRLLLVLLSSVTLTTKANHHTPGLLLFFNMLQFFYAFEKCLCLLANLYIIPWYLLRLGS